MEDFGLDFADEPIDCEFLRFSLSQAIQLFVNELTGRPNLLLDGVLDSLSEDNRAGQRRGITKKQLGLLFQRPICPLICSCTHLAPIYKDFFVSRKKTRPLLGGASAARALRSRFRQVCQRSSGEQSN